jgi:hypothetical protein
MSAVPSGGLSDGPSAGRYHRVNMQHLTAPANALREPDDFQIETLNFGHFKIQNTISSIITNFIGLTSTLLHCLFSTELEPRKFLGHHAMLTF